MSPRTAKNDAIKQKKKDAGAKKHAKMVTNKKTSQTITPKKTPPVRVSPQKIPLVTKKTTLIKGKTDQNNNDEDGRKVKANTPKKTDQNNDDERKVKPDTPKSRNVYTLIITNNRKKVQFENKTSLQTFLGEYSSTVRFQETFKNKKSMTDYINKQEEDEEAEETERNSNTDLNVASLAVVLDTDHMVSDKDHAAAQRIMDRMRSRSPATNRVLIDAHTNDSSDCCIAVIREVDNKGKMKWWTKGNMTAPVIANFIEDQLVQDKTIQEALANMDFADKRKDGGGPNEKEEETGRMKIKDEKGRDKWVDNGQSYPVTISFTHFGFDHKNFLNKKEETLWLEETLHKIGKEFIRIRMNSVFLLLLQQQITEKQWNAMMNGTHYPYGYPDFYSKCRVVVNFTQNLNELVTTNSKNLMDDYLLEKIGPNYELKYKKYIKNHNN